MAWFVVQKKGERARIVAGGELLGAVYCARAEVRVAGFATYEAAQCAVAVADTKLGIRMRRADVKRTADALEAAVQAHRKAPTEQTLDAVKMASAAHSRSRTPALARPRPSRALANYYPKRPPALLVVFDHFRASARSVLFSTRSSVHSASCAADAILTASSVCSVGAV